VLQQMKYLKTFTIKQDHIWLKCKYKGIEDTINSLKCNSDYGKPSGHSMNSVVMIFLMPFLLFPQLRKLRKSEVNVEMPERNLFILFKIPNLTLDTLLPAMTSLNRRY
jgi:membrane-associated phospholipid phosphatase